MSCTLEHTAQMANIINKARIKQRSLVITLLYLKNAFGEVHHNLITSVLDYHHIPEHVKLIIKSLYTDFKTSIITSEFRTPFIPVRRGVLQGGCLSPLLFNMCFNTFIQHIKTDKYRPFGFSLQFLNPVHWFQFADDAAVISSQESENQHLLNRFSIWCQWSNMIIRVDKCSTFGIKKALTKSIQYLPKLLINKQLIPKINNGEAFQYLGRYFSFNMSDEQHKSELISLVEELMADIDSKPLHPKNKILLYSRYLLSKLSWHFTVSSVSKTWVTENIDSKVNSYIKIWSACQSNLPKNIFNFTVRYINNSLPTRQNLARWDLSPTSDCSRCLAPGTLLHVVAGCQSYLERSTWRHDSVLNFLATNLQTVSGSHLYVDLPGYKSPSIITGDTYRPDLLLLTSTGTLYIVELTVGFESNLQKNVERKKSKYKELIGEQNEHFNSVKFVNLSISSLGVFSKEYSTFIEMLNDFGFQKQHQNYCIRRMTTIAIRTTYYIFCCRNKEWMNPELLTV